MAYTRIVRSQQVVALVAGLGDHQGWRMPCEERFEMMDEIVLVAVVCVVFARGGRALHLGLAGMRKVSDA